MQDKRCKQTERFSVMGKRNDYFLPLDDKSKQRYKVKFNKIQEYDAYQTKIEELSGDIGKFSIRAVTQPIIVNYYLLPLTPQTKERLKACENLKSYNQFALGWVKEVNMKLFVNYLLK